MKANKYANIILNTTKLLLSCTFLYAAIIKGSEFTHFASEMKKSPILEPYNTTLIGISVLAFEVITALLLSFQKTVRYGLHLSYFIMLLFSGYLYILYTKYPNAPCSCGGILGYLPYPVHIAFNFILTLLSLTAILLNKNFKHSHDAGAFTPLH
jgi:hypothetical protein